MLFNIALTHKRSQKSRRTLDAFQTYLRDWRARYPALSRYPLQERAHFEIGEAAFALGSSQLALDHLRRAKKLWQKHFPGKRAAFADEANRRIAQCLAKLGRKREAADAYAAFLTEHQKAKGSEHPDATHVRKLIAKLTAPPPSAPATAAGKQPQLASQPAPTPPPPKPAATPAPQSETSDPGPADSARERNTGWLVASVTGAALTAGTLALGIGFHVKAEDTLNTTDDFSRARGLAYGGYAAAGVLAIATGVSIYLYLISGKRLKRRANHATWHAWQLSPGAIHLLF